MTTPEQPVRRTAAADGRLCLDFGRATFGWLRMEFARPHPPLDLRVRFGEKRLADGLIDTNPGGSIVSQEVAIRGEASASRLDVHPSWTPKYANWIPLPDRAGEVAPFRYVEIIGLPPDLAPTAILRLSRHVPFDEDASAFDCSEPALVEIWDLCKHSIKATSFAGLYVDGNRERVPYEADAYINQLCHYAVDSHYQTGRLTYEHLLDYPTWPTEWRQHLPLMAWADWLYSGDDSGLRRNYDRLREQLMLERRRPDGLFVGQSRGVPRDIVDWPQGERDGYDMRPDVKTVTSAFHARSLEAMAEIAAAIGKPSEADGFRTLRQETIRTMRARLFDERRGCYVDGLTTGGEAASGHASLHANMLPLAFGLVDPPDVPRVAAFVAGKGMACSVYGSQYLLDGLFDAGEEQAAYALLTAGGDRGWLHMSRVLGSTITLEAWDAAYKPNLDWNHAWGAVPANVIARKLMGIEPLEPGFRRVRIRPQIARLERAFIRQPSPRGAIELTVVQTDARWEARVVIPRGVTGEVHLPESRAGDARGLSSASNGTAASHPDSGRRVVEVRAGRTSITMHAGREAPVVTRSGDGH